jgi:hypothetical protein
VVKKIKQVKEYLMIPTFICGGTFKILGNVIMGLIFRKEILTKVESTYLIAAESMWHFYCSGLKSYVIRYI